MKKRTWIIGIVVFLFFLLLLWNTITGGHGLVLQLLGIFALVMIGSFILAVCIMRTVPADPGYVPPEKKENPKKESNVDAGKVVSVSAKAAFFPAYMIYATGKKMYSRRKRKSKEFWNHFRPWY